MLERHAGDLGRRVRPYAIRAGRAQARQLRPRSSRPRILAVDGGRRRQARATFTAARTTTGSMSSEGGVHVHDLQATILHLLGIDHEKLTYLFQGRQFRLTDVGGQVVKQILA